MDTDKITSSIISSAWDVWHTLGFGFVENVYKQSLGIELRHKGFDVKIEQPVTVYYRNQNAGNYFCDILINDTVIVETKVVKSIIPAHIKQAKNYLNATRKKTGLIINFTEYYVKVKRIYY